MRTILVLFVCFTFQAKALDWIRVSDDKSGFVCASTGEKFIPWGFNYDRDDAGRLLEDYWADEWQTVAEDFAEMKALNANVVRVHPIRRVTA